MVWLEDDGTVGRAGGRNAMRVRSVGCRVVGRHVVVEAWDADIFQRYLRPDLGLTHHSCSGARRF